MDENVIQVSTGWELSMFLKEDGSVWTMGSNRLGKLGIGEVGGNNEGSFTNRNLPTRIVEGGIQSIGFPLDVSCHDDRCFGSISKTQQEHTVVCDF